MEDSTTQAEQVIKPRRWRVRFGLRTLWIAVTVIGVLLAATAAWYHAQEAEYRRQLQVAEQLAKYGEITWELQPPPWLKWAGDWQVFQRIGLLNCYGTVAPSDVFDAVASVPSIHDVYFYCNRDQCNEELIEKLSRMKQLRKLFLKFDMEYWTKAYEEASASREKMVDELVEKLHNRLPNISVQKKGRELL